jgi:hypothetical protein
MIKVVIELLEKKVRKSKSKEDRNIRIGESA